MRIGIISAASENLIIAQMLCEMGHEVVVLYDQEHRPHGDKTHERRMQIVADHVAVLQHHDIEGLIVNPVVEMALTRDPTYSSSFLQQTIKLIPLFAEYVKMYCLQYSLVGKLGLAGSYADGQVAQGLIKYVTSSYELRAVQQQTKSFKSDFPVWFQEIQALPYYQETTKRHDPYVNKLIKQHLRPFKDAAIDTLIPLSYGLFHHQAIIKTFFNHKVTRFHPKQDLNNVLISSIGAGDGVVKPATMLVIGSSHRLDRQSHWKRALSGGKPELLKMVVKS